MATDTMMDLEKVERIRKGLPADIWRFQKAVGVHMLETNVFKFKF